MIESKKKRWALIAWLAIPAFVSAAQTGELRIEGGHIARLVLVRDDGHTESFDMPGQSVTLPEGTYQVTEVGVEGFQRMSKPYNQDRYVTIRQDEPAVLEIGGPLNPAVGIERQGRVLVLNYELVGAGGERYAGATQQPTFAVRQGKRTIGVGQFEYG